MNKATAVNFGKHGRDDIQYLDDTSVDKKEENVDSLFWTEQRRAVLQTDGFVVIPQVMSASDCDRYSAEIKHIIAAMNKEGKVVANDASTWTASNLPTSLHGIFQGYNLGHIRPVWDVRQDRNVNDVFAGLYNTRRLLSSFDALCVIPPWELRGKRYKPDNGTRWWHVDQGKRKVGFHCAQGLVTLDEMQSDDATLRVLQHGHLLHESMLKHFQTTFPHGDWLRLSDEHIRWLQEKDHRVREVAVSANKGDLVLWDSRTPHCNCMAQAGRKTPRWRVVVYVCQMPAPSDQDQLDKLLRDKRAKFASHTVTPHWPLSTRSFASRPHYGKDPTEFNSLEPYFATEEDLTPIGRQFAGFPQL